MVYKTTKYVINIFKIVIQKTLNIFVSNYNFNVDFPLKYAIVQSSIS